MISITITYVLNVNASKRYRSIKDKATRPRIEEEMPSLLGTIVGIAMYWNVSTFPVKLIKAKNDKHVQHIDGYFCTATIWHLEELASMLGPNEVCFISQDNKARVRIEQSPLKMHVEYRVSLPDYDWVVATGHKLIPLVYAGIQIQSNGLGNREAVRYSGPTYIAMRSGKHSSSTAFC